METVKEINKYVKMLSKEQQEVLLKQLRLSQLMDEAKRIDSENAAHQKKNKVKTVSMKQIVEIVHKVRVDTKRKHAA